MRTETLHIIRFVGIFKNRRVPVRANNLDSTEVKSEDGTL